jgi:hypothetical protein
VTNDLMTRLVDNVTLSESGCWDWTGATNSRGYGRITFMGRTTYAHRQVWETVVGAIPDGLELDHLCRNTMCVNPDHLEPVTHAENIRRSPTGAEKSARYAAWTHCRRGHERTPENTRIGPDGVRRCRPCHALGERRRRQERQA